MTGTVYFPTISPIKYTGVSSSSQEDATTTINTSSSPISFKYYAKDEIILGKKMSEWLKFSVCFWHTFRGIGQDPFGSATLKRPWDTIDPTDLGTKGSEQRKKVIDSCKCRVSVTFDVCDPI